MRRLMQGNEAVFRGALAAGASYYAGYPISPSTEILNVASGWAAEHPEFGFLQAEDEIASANAVIGASLAGAKAFTATSGPGFSLMQEAIGYAQKQRPWPPDTDIRWSLAGLEGREAMLRLEGPSMGAAFASGMETLLAALEHRPP